MQTNSRPFRIQVSHNSSNDLWQQALVTPGDVCAVWDYFEYNEDENKSVCTVTTTEGSQCLIKIAILWCYIRVKIQQYSGYLWYFILAYKFFRRGTNFGVQISHVGAQISGRGYLFREGGINCLKGYKFPKGIQISQRGSTYLFGWYRKSENIRVANFHVINFCAKKIS